MEYKGLPVYNIDIDMDNDEYGLICNSLVAEPAVCVDYLKFKEDKKLIFATEENDKHIITGVSLLADSPIYRRDGYFEYYVVFTKDTIRQLVEKYSKDGYNNITSLQHNGEPIDSCIMIESYFIDKERGICPKEFSDIPDGSWITSYKVTDEELWNEIKNGDTLNGFSVEVNCDLIPTPDEQHIEEERTEELEMDEWEAFVKWLCGELDDEDILFSNVKKNFVSQGDLRGLLEENKICEITVGSRTRYGQLHNINGTGESATVQIFFPSKKRIGTAMEEYDIDENYREANLTDGGDYWETVSIDEIKNVRTTKYPLLQWNYEVNSYKPVVEYNPSKTTKDTASGGQVNSIDYAMTNNYMAMIEYSDESEEPATGMRQIWIGHIAETTRNQECLIAYEYYGDSKTGINGGAWRTFLTRRIRSFRVNTMEKVTIAPAGFNPAFGGDDTINYVKRTAIL